MTSPEALASSPKTFLERDNWMRSVLASDLPDAAVRIAMSIALHLRVSTGQCTPSYPTLAAESHISERSTYRLVDLLEHRGWIGITRTSGYGNQYSLVTPDRAMAGATPDKAMAGVKRMTPDSRDRGTPVSSVRGTPANMLAGEKRSKRTKKEREKSQTHAPDVAARDLKRSAAKTNAARPKPNSDDDSFERFWALYPKRVAKEAARRAWAKATERGVDPQTLIAGARRYAGERLGQEPRYTKHPSTWLNGGCWEDEPPGGTVIDEDGNLVALERPRRQEPQTVEQIIADVVAMYEDEEEDRYGNLH